MNDDYRSASWKGRRGRVTATRLPDGHIEVSVASEPEDADHGIADAELSREHAVEMARWILDQAE